MGGIGRARKKGRREMGLVAVPDPEYVMPSGLTWNLCTSKIVSKGLGSPMQGLDLSQRNRIKVLSPLGRPSMVAAEPQDAKTIAVLGAADIRIW